MAEREPTLADFLKSIWNLKFFVVVGGILGTCLAYGLLWTAIPQYKATMLVAPAAGHNNTAPDITSFFSGGYSGIMPPAADYITHGLSSGSSHADFSRFEAILKEVSVAHSLMQEEGFSQKVAMDVPFRFAKQKIPVTAEDVAAYLRKHIKIEPVGSTAIKRIIYIHPDRDFAVTQLKRMVTIADRMIHDEAQSKNEGRVAYLQKALDNTAHPDHRRILTSLLMEQEHMKMVLAMNESYAAIVIEPPSATAKPYWPNKAIIYGLCLMVGLFLGYGSGAVCRYGKA